MAFAFHCGHASARSIAAQYIAACLFFIGTAAEAAADYAR
jgi:hypothetical protein